MFKGAVLNIKFGAFYVFSRVFFTPLRYDYPSDVTLVLWQYGSRIRGGLLYTFFETIFMSTGTIVKVTTSFFFILSSAHLHVKGQEKSCSQFV